MPPIDRTSEQSAGATRLAVRVVAVFLILLAWGAALVAGENLARRYGGFTIAEGRPALVDGPHTEGVVTLETLNGVTVWRRKHPERPLPRPVKSGFRIVVIGDSILAPALVSDGEGMVRLLEKELNTRLDRGPYEVVNLSEGGWNTLQEEQVLLEDGLPLAPDLVLLGVSPNDTQEFAYRDGALLMVRFLADMDARTTSGLLGLLGQHSYLYNWLWLSWKARAFGVEPVRHEDVQRLILQPIQRMTDATRAKGGKFAVLCFPRLIQERFDPVVDTVQSCFGELVLWTETAGLPLLLPVPAYAAYPNADLRLDHIHLSPLGHRVLTRATFDWLVSHHLVPYSTVRPAAPTKPR